jgi:hypothetical protein
MVKSICSDFLDKDDAEYVLKLLDKAYSNYANNIINSNQNDNVNVNIINSRNNDQIYLPQPLFREDILD